VSEAPQLEDGSNLMDTGRGGTWSALDNDAHLVGVQQVARGKATGRAAVAPRRRRRGTAGHRGRQSVIGERGNPPMSPSPVCSQQDSGGKTHRRLKASGGDGGSVVLRGRESRPHGEGSQQACSREHEKEAIGEYRCA
jgi:hypothetical protein